MVGVMCFWKLHEPVGRIACSGGECQLTCTLGQVKLTFRLLPRCLLGKGEGYQSREGPLSWGTTDCHQSAGEVAAVCEESAPDGTSLAAASTTP